MGKESTCNSKDTGDAGSISRLEDPLEKEMATHFSILAWKIPMHRGAWRATVHGVTDMAEHTHTLKILSRCFSCRMCYAAVVWESPWSMGSPGLKRSLRDVGKGWVI